MFSPLHMDITLLLRARVKMSLLETCAEEDPALGDLHYKSSGCFEWMLGAGYELQKLDLSSASYCGNRTPSMP